jgi:hypothetical protein
MLAGLAQTRAQGFGTATATAGTVIRLLLRPFRGAYGRIQYIRYTCGATAHTLTIRASIGVLFVSANAAAGQAVVKVAAQPGSAGVAGTVRALASGDILVFERYDPGTQMDAYDLNVVSGTPVINADGSVTITLTNNIPAGQGYLAPTGLTAGGAQTNPNFNPTSRDPTAKGTRVWLMSADADVIPGYNLTPPKYNVTVSVANDYPSANVAAAVCGLFETWNPEEPLIIESNNITAAGKFEIANGYGVSGVSAKGGR